MHCRAPEKQAHLAVRLQPPGERQQDQLTAKKTEFRFRRRRKQGHGKNIRSGAPSLTPGDIGVRYRALCDLANRTVRAQVNIWEAQTREERIIDFSQLLPRGCCETFSILQFGTFNKKLVRRKLEGTSFPLSMSNSHCVNIGHIYWPEIKHGERRMKYQESLRATCRGLGQRPCA